MSQDFYAVFDRYRKRIITILPDNGILDSVRYSGQRTMQLLVLESPKISWVASATDSVATIRRVILYFDAVYRDSHLLRWEAWTDDEEGVVLLDAHFTRGHQMTFERTRTTRNFDNSTS